MIDIVEYCGPEWAEWYLMTPQQRWEESDKLWGVYLMLGGSLECGLQFETQLRLGKRAL